MEEFSLKGKQARILVSKSLLDLEPLLREWVKVVFEYLEAHQDDSGKVEDCCWWYGERATLSTLAAAAWRVKEWGALEEFPTLKNHVKDGERNSKYGRCDLYIYGAKTSYACEAKQVRLALKQNDESEKISAGRTAAWRDVGKLDNEEANKRLALCFCVPYIKAKPNQEKFRKQLIDEWIDYLVKTLHFSALAAVFPRNTESLDNDAGYIYPGVVLIIQERHKGNGKSGSSKG